MNTIRLCWREATSLDPELDPEVAALLPNRAQYLAVLFVLWLRVPLWLLIITPPGWSTLWTLFKWLTP